MDDIPALVQEGGKIVDILPHADLSGFGVGAVFHALIKHVKGNALAQIVRVGLAVQIKMEANIAKALDRSKRVVLDLKRKRATQLATYLNEVRPTWDSLQNKLGKRRKLNGCIRKDMSFGPSGRSLLKCYSNYVKTG